MRIRTLVSAAALLALSGSALASPQETVTYTNVQSGNTTGIVGTPGGNPGTSGTQVRTATFTGSYTVTKIRVPAGANVSEIGFNTGTFANEARIYVTPSNGGTSFVVQPTTTGSYTTSVTTTSTVFVNLPVPQAANAGDGIWNFRFFEDWQDSPLGTADQQWTTITFTLDDGVILPPSFTHDFGSLDPTQTSQAFNSSVALTVPQNGVQWCKFVLSGNVTAASRTWLDIDTETSALTPTNATKVALYDGATGLPIVTGGNNTITNSNDSTDGTDSLSQLSYGFTTGRPAPGNGVAYNGRDGSAVGAGTYYVAVIGNGTTTFGSDFGPVTTGGTNTGGTAVLRVRAGFTPPPAPPAVFTDLGNVNPVSGTTVSSSNISLGANGVAWFKFVLTGAVSKTAFSYLDIDTETSALAPANDTNMALYTNLGALVSSDDDDGSALFSQLTYGRQGRGGAGANPNAGLSYNGRDGATRAADTYWVAVVGKGTTTFGADWAVTQTSANTGTVKLNVRAGTYASGDPALAGPVTDLGTISTCPTNFAGTLMPTEIKWYKFFLPVAVSVANNNYLDLDTEGSALSGTNDTEIALYSSTGAFITFDDDDGTNNFSQLTYGQGSTSIASPFYRAPVGNGLNYSGRDGSLAIGTYYFCASAFDSVQNTTNWDVTSTSAQFGSWVVHIKYGDYNIPAASEPVSAPLLATLDPASFGPGGGSSATASSTDTISGPGQFKWYKIVLSSAVSSAARTWLDIDTEGSTIGGLATSIALYSQATGNPVASDNDDGSGSLSQLTFGVGGLGSRAAVGGMSYNGRDGALAAGTYYLAVTPYPGAFNNTWAVLNCGSAIGNVTVRAKAGFTPIIFPALAHTFAPISDPATCQVFAPSSPGEALAVGSVNWYKMTLPAIAAASGTYCDITTNGSTLDTNSWEPGFIDDTFAAIYDATGAGLFGDDDTGQDNGSAFSFGATSPSRVNGTNGAALVGQTAATLAAGDYYVAVIEFDDNAVFANDFGVTAGAGHVGGTTKLNVTVGKTAGSPTTVNGAPGSSTSIDPLIADNAWHASGAIPVSATGVTWLTFTAPDFSVARTYLDMDMEGSTGLNLALAVFTNAGAVEDSDTADGTGTLPQLSYGFAFGRPGPGGDALNYNGRDGTLTAGANYYIAVVAEQNDAPSTFATNWAITTPASCTTPSGSAIFRYRTGVQGPATPPTVNQDLGALGPCTSPLVSNTFTIGAAQFVWVKFTIASPTDANTYVDMHTVGSVLTAGTFGPNDTEFGIYHSDGTFVDSSDDSGAARESLLSFGGTAVAARTYPPGFAGALDPAAGGDGNLTADTYYVALGAFNVDFPAEFGATATNTQTGTVKVTIHTNASNVCPTIGTDNTNQTVACNGTANFTVGVADAGAATYQWRKNGVALANGALPNGAVISGATTTTLTITGVRNSNGSVGVGSTPGGYDVVITTNNPCCAATLSSAVASLTITPHCPCNQADIAQLGGGLGADGQLTVDDLVTFLSNFFSGNLAVADLTNLGGSGGPDGAITVDDLVFFLSKFFSPCTNP
ncbi:MAG: GC-type dockerin domain-anchored protein [Phycisphaerales bacterium]